MALQTHQILCTDPHGQVDSPVAGAMGFQFAVLYGSTRSDRHGIGAARFIAGQLKERGHEVTLLDACELDLPMLDKMYKEFPEGEAPADMEKAHQALDEADGYVLVGGEWNHSVPPGLKNLLDHFQPEYFFKPAGIATYSAGPFGGVRAAPHYRAILGELGMVTPSTMFSISKVQDSFDTDGTVRDEAYIRRIKQFLDELEWYTDALKAKREADGTPF